MSTKKEPVKKKASPAQKPASKKPVPSKKPAAPAKKSAPARKAPSLVKKSVTSKAPSSKGSKKAVVSKKIEPRKKVAVTKASKPATGKNNITKKSSSTAKNVRPSVLPKKASIAKVKAKKSAAKPVSDNSKKSKQEKKVPVKNSKAETKPLKVHDLPSASPVPESSKNSKQAKPEKIQEEPDDAVLLAKGAKLSKVAFFMEVDEQEDRVNKKKVSADMKGVEKPTLPMRRKASLAEETPEELYARVIAELEEENQSLNNELSRQICVKCCKNLVSPEYRVDKDLGYCEECAEILGLGHTKEARHLDYQMGLMGGDSLDEDRPDDDFDEQPTPEDIAKADKDLDLEDDPDVEKNLSKDIDL
ncbi:MAG: hypothetical protein M0P13_00545 [Fibrobacteraceae bacterium]|nr:hypothetical protein [Fibrobacteraceae bacterium]